MKALELKNLTKKFGDFIAVDNINFSIEEGEIVGFLGPNGAGKSTTINMVSGLLRADEGEVRIFGKKINENPKYVKSNIGLVPQDIAIYPNLTAYENVKFFAGLYGLRGKKLNESVMNSLEFVGLLGKEKDFTENFSGGMKRRLNIACAITHRPKFIIMDEPTVGIDPQSRNYILESIKYLNRNGSTIIYTSHYIEEVEELCSRIAIIENGKIIADGTKEELKSIVTDVNEYVINVSNIDRVDIEDLKKLKGIIGIKSIDDKLIFKSNVEENNLNEIIAYLIKEQIEIKNVISKIPTLETVFLTLTGKNLRD